MDNTRWGVVTPVFNGDKYILDCMHSVSNQTVKPLHIIQDGLSNDSTLTIISEFSKSSQNEIVLYSEKDKGIYDGMNKGISKLDKEFVAILNSDDFFYKEDVLERVQLIFDQNPDTMMVYTNVNVTDNNKIIRDFSVKKHVSKLEDFFSGIQLPHPGMFFRGEVYKKMNYQNNMKISADYEFQLRFFNEYGNKAKFLDIIGTIQRAGGMSQNGLKSFLLGKYEMIVALRNNCNIGFLESIVVVFKNLLIKRTQLLK